MRTPLLAALLSWASLTGCGGGASEPAEPPRPGAVVLVPDPEKSFLQANLRLVLVGEGWALEANFTEPAFQWYRTDFAATLPRDFLMAASEAFLYRLGPGDAGRFVPSAGPLNRFALERGNLPKAEVQDLRATVRAREHAREPKAAVEVTVGPFTAEGRRHGPVGPVTLRLRGPYP